MNSGDWYVCGGTIAYNGTSGSGGGIQPSSYDSFELSGSASVKHNTAAGSGNGVYVSLATNLNNGVSGIFSMKGNAYVDSDNDLYLSSSSASKITITGALNPPEAAGGIVAKITPNSYTRTEPLLVAADGVSTDVFTAACGKFAVTPNAGKNYVVNSDGKIAEDTGFVLVNGATVSGAVSGSNVFVTNRTVTIRSMYVCKHEVTQAEYQSIMGTNPSQFNGSPADGEVQEKRPVEYVSWYAAIVYCNKRSAAENLNSCYSIGGSTNPSNWGTPPTSDNSTWDAVSCDWSANGYRLPTEAEWEYIARGGNNGIPATQTDFSGSNTAASVAWYTSNSGNEKTHQVMLKTPNTLGIYDLSGNVHEWCWDKYAADGSITADTPDDGPTSFRGGAYAGEGSTHVKRGGFYGTSEIYLTVSESRDYFAASVISGSCGFRVVRTANTTPGS
jgi:formylglycine-generating enzyme required for sulfatase activity